MKIAISGGTGFIGRPLAARLAQSGHDLVFLSRTPDKVKGLPPRSETAFFDATRPFPTENLRGAEAVIHLAGESVGRRWNDEVKQQILHSRAQGTAALARAARESGTVKVFLAASGVGFYGDRGDETLTEDSAPGNDFLSRVCLEWEAPVLGLKSAGIRAAVFRLGVVLHPEGGALARMLPPFKLGAGGPMGSGRQYFAFVHREDVLRVFEAALTDPKFEGPFNVVAPNPVTNKEFTRALGRALHRPAFVPVPAFALRMLFAEMADQLLTGQRALPNRLTQLGFQFRFPDVDSTLGDLLGR